MRVAYVNGAYVPYQHATVAMEDRGYQFADGLYEVVMFYNETFLDWDLHIQRWHRSLGELRIPEPMSDRALKIVATELRRRNHMRDGHIYMQVTRGVARRNHAFPDIIVPSLTMAIMPARPMPHDAYTSGVCVITHPDQRWGRCDIKSIALLPNVLAKQAAKDVGAMEVFLYNTQQCLTEGALSSAYIVKDGTVYTHKETNAVLPGVRKTVIKRLCREHNVPYCDTQDIPLEMVRAADEAFLSSANSHVLPVTTIDNMPVGQGKPGDITLQLLRYYQQHVTQQTGKQWDI